MAGIKQSDRVQRADEFREQLGDRKIGVDDYKVDELRKIASAFGVVGSHGKTPLRGVFAIMSS
jgi:hypothetical protein